MRRIHAAFVCAALCAGCGVYTFSGSTLPSHLKTVTLPVFLNQSLQPDVAEDLTAKINQKVLTTNLLKIVSTDGDATLSGTVTRYTNHPYTYGSEGYRNVNVTQYAVSISVDVLFQDNRKNEPLYKGAVSGEGIYDLSTENEAAGRQRAIDLIVQQILQNSVQSW
jgi:hypothetical protein